jgi:chaperonin cofactor prefoldin
MELTDFITSWAPLLFSALVMAERIWSRANDKLGSRVEDLQRRIESLQSFKDRVDGAALLDRVTLVESRQRVDENALARVDQRLESVDDRLETLLSVLRSQP